MASSSKNDSWCAHLGNDHLLDVRQVGAELSRPAVAVQPVGQRGALGNAHAVVPAHDGIPLAGRPHGPCHARRGRRRDTSHAGRVSHVHGRVHGHARDHRPEDGRREVCRRAAHVLHRSHDAGQQGVAGGHVTQPRPKFRQGVRPDVPERSRAAGSRVEHELGRVHTHDRRPGDDAQRRCGLAPAAAPCAHTDGHRAHLEDG